MKPIIKLENVWKTYHLGKVQVHAVRGLSLTIKKSEFVTIEGPSGSGKTTTMALIGCLDKPTKGKIFIDGKDVSKLNDNQLADIRGKKIGFVFQAFNLIPTLDALKNVALPMLFQGINKKQRETRARELLNIVGLSHRLFHKPNEMSGGEQQRVAIARALANNPEIILADEPTGNLDSKTGREIMEIFKKLNKQGKTIVIVTHDPEIAKYGERILLIRDGKLFKEIKQRGS